MEEELEKWKKRNKSRKVVAIIVTVITILILFIEVPWLILLTDIYSGIAKPILYLYPEQETQITVKLLSPEKLTTTYPKYKNEWKVMAQPNGDLKDMETGRNLYALYWEGKNTNVPHWESGFCVKGSDTIAFLEEKLAILGLNEREAEEFIVYWLPQMEQNPYNLIRFETMEEINQNMPLEITPAPDTLIRVVMDFKPVKKEIQIPEQELIKVERKGYTVVEWGGSKIH